MLSRILSFALTLLLLVATVLVWRPGTINSFRQLAQTAPPAARQGPAFFVYFADGVGRVYSEPQASDASGDQYTDDHLTATVSATSTNQWQLALTNKDQAIVNVLFPWEPTTSFLGDDPSDDLVYYPYIFGTVARMDSMPVYDSPRSGAAAGQGLAYPGTAFAPLVVTADDAQARIVAATNWPPKPMTPEWSRGRLMLDYRAGVAPGAALDLNIIDTKVAAGAGEPWQAALDLYKTWLRERMTAAGLTPDYPEQLKNAEGWFNVELQNMNAFDPAYVRTTALRWKALFPWVQFWGQMSNYAGDPKLAQPPLASGEQVGCCLEQTALHSRYLSDTDTTLPSLAAELKSAGLLVGFYARPEATYGPLTLPANLSYLLSWITADQSSGANAQYLDVVGRHDFGDPLSVARYFIDGTFPQASVIEGMQDIYPVAGLISGSLAGGDYNGGPDNTITQVKSGASPQTTFPQFGRYLLSDRIVLLGYSNGDSAFWGAANNYWTERQAFLLGAKFDAATIGDPDNRSIELNKAIKLASDERARVGWWAREPEYLDTSGVTEIPAGVQVRHFKDNQGKDLFAVDNWSGTDGLFFGFGGGQVAIPTAQLSILDSPEVVIPPPPVKHPSGGSSGGGGGGSINNNPPPPALGVEIPATTFPPLTALFAVHTSGSHVAELQQMLSVDHYYTRPITGYYDEPTVSAVEAFQTKYNLAASGSPGWGLAGPATRAKLNELYALPTTTRQALIRQLQTQLLGLLQQLLKLLTS